MIAGNKFPRPTELVLVRHGETHRNTAMQDWDNKEELAAANMLLQHERLTNLTELGIKQAKIAGEWLRNNIDINFDGYYVSYYPRTWQTAGNLQLPGSKWRMHALLNERSNGIFDYLSPNESKELYPQLIQDKNNDPLGWQAPGGESVYHVMNRVRHFVSKLNNDHPDQRVIVVCHGRVITAFRIILEHLSPLDYFDRTQENQAEIEVPNCSILRFLRTRVNSDQVSERYNCVEQIVPWDLQHRGNTVRKINRPTYSSDDLLEMAERLYKKLQI